MFFKTEKKLRALMNDIMNVRHSLLDKEAFIKNKINDTERYTKQLKERINTLSDRIQDDSEVSSNYLADHTNRIAELEKKVDAITEFLKSDRNDINALIQIVRKLQSTKGKK